MNPVDSKETGRKLAYQGNLVIYVVLLVIELTWLLTSQDEGKIWIILLGFPFIPFVPRIFLGILQPIFFVPIWLKARKEGRRETIAGMTDVRLRVFAWSSIPLSIVVLYLGMPLYINGPSPVGVCRIEGDGSMPFTSHCPGPWERKFWERLRGR